MSVLDSPLTLGERIRRLRRAAGVDQAELAAELGVVRSTVSRWETDHFAPRVALLFSLSVALGVRPEALWGDS